MFGFTSCFCVISVFVSLPLSLYVTVSVTLSHSSSLSRSLCASLSFSLFCDTMSHCHNNLDIKSPMSSKTQVSCYSTSNCMVFFVLFLHFKQNGCIFVCMCVCVGVGVLACVGVCM